MHHSYIKGTRVTVMHHSLSTNLVQCVGLPFILTKNVTVQAVQSAIINNSNQIQSNVLLLFLPFSVRCRLPQIENIESINIRLTYRPHLQFADRMAHKLIWWWYIAIEYEAKRRQIIISDFHVTYPGGYIWPNASLRSLTRVTRRMYNTLFLTLTHPWAQILNRHRFGTLSA